LKRSPAKIIELCVYILIIVAAIIWLLAKGSIYAAPYISPPAVTQTEPSNTIAPPVIVPKGEIIPGD